MSWRSTSGQGEPRSSPYNIVTADYVSDNKFTTEAHPFCFPNKNVALIVCVSWVGTDHPMILFPLGITQVTALLFRTHVKPDWDG